MITLSITTCKRFNCFENMIRSFVKNCADLDLISEIILVDDNSSMAEKSKISNILISSFPNKKIKFYFKDHSETGHCKSMNIVMSMVSNDYLFQNEDDWLFCVKDNFIRKSLKIIENNYDVGIVSLRNIREKDYDWVFGRYVEKNVDNIFFKIHEEPGFTLNPSIQSLSKIKKHMDNIVFLEKNSSNIEDGFESNFSKRYHDSGLRTAFFSRNSYIKHIGFTSAYDINKTKR